MRVDSVFFSRVEGERNETIAVDLTARDDEARMPDVVVLRLDVPTDQLIAGRFASRRALDAMERLQADFEDRFCGEGVWPFSRHKALRSLSRRTVASNGAAWRELAYAVPRDFRRGPLMPILKRWPAGGLFRATLQDGDWDSHYHVLMPTALELHMTGLRQKLRRLAGEGIDLIPPQRRVHQFTVGRDGDAGDVARALLAAGFQEVRTGAKGVSCVSVEPLTPVAIEPVDSQLLAIADASGSDYRGFRLEKLAAEDVVLDQASPIMLAKPVSYASLSARSGRAAAPSRTASPPTKPRRLTGTSAAIARVTRRWVSGSRLATT